MNRFLCISCLVVVLSIQCVAFRQRMQKVTRSSSRLNMVQEYFPFEASVLQSTSQILSENSHSVDVVGLTESLNLASDDAIAPTGYSSVSLYFTLALYVLTLPGLYSLVTRSVKASLTQKTYDVPGPANPTAKPLRQTAAEIMAYFKAMNYEVDAAEEVIKFKGVMGRSKSQASFLTFCTFMGLGSIGLVLSILIPEVGSKAYLLTLLSPYAGIYYWNNAQRVDEVKIKMETSDDEQITSIIAQGGKEDLERFSKTLNLPERGKVYVKGFFDDGSGAVTATIPVPADSPVAQSIAQNAATAAETTMPAEGDTPKEVDNDVSV